MAEKKNAEEVYSTCYHVKRRKTYLEERDVANGVFYYSALDTEQINGKDAIRNLFSSLCVDVAGYEVMAQRLHQCIAQLSKEEQALVFALCFQGKTQVELKRETGIKQQTTSYRNHQIRLKPKKMKKIKIFFVDPLTKPD